MSSRRIITRLPIRTALSLSPAIARLIVQRLTLSNRLASLSVKNSLACSSVLLIEISRTVSTMLFSTFWLRPLCLYALEAHPWEQYFVTVVRAVKLSRQCWQILVILMLELILKYILNHFTL